MLCYLAVVMTCLANGSDSKKQRLDEAPPSRVLHIRKLPNEVSETEVIALGLPFGKVTNILMLKGKNQVTTTFHILGSGGAFCKIISVMTFPLCTGVPPGISGVGYRGGCHNYGQLLLSCHTAGQRLNFCSTGFFLLFTFREVNEVFLSSTTTFRSEMLQCTSSTPTTRSWRRTRLWTRWNILSSVPHTWCCWCCCCSCRLHCYCCRTAAANKL